ncbi:hypothetical protein EBZ37_15425, partial [bacterium]|nr:hypothetical protein [bacterium]
MMIKINLAKTRKKNAAQKGSSEGIFKLFGGAFKKSEGLDQAAFNPRRVLMAFAVVGGVFFYLEEIKQEEVLAWKKRIAVAQKEQDKLKGELSKYKNLEFIKKKFEIDEQLLTKKIELVEPILRQQEQPHRVLMGLSKSIPNDLWLKS